MNRIILFLRLHQKALLISVATTISVGAIAVYATVYRDAPAGPAAQPVIVSSAPAPTEPHYPGDTGEDTDDGTRIYEPGPPASPAADAVDVARKFTIAWARPTLTTEAWLAGVDDYATNDYIRPLRDIDPGRVPASAVTGEPVVFSSRTDQVIIDVPTNAGTLRLTVVSLVGQWWVSYTEWQARA